MSILQQLSLQLIPLDGGTLTLEQNFFFLLRCGNAKSGLSSTAEEFVDAMTDLAYNSNFTCSLASIASSSALSSEGPSSINEDSSAAVCTMIAEPTLTNKDGQGVVSGSESMVFVDLMFCTVISNAHIDTHAPTVPFKALLLSIEHIVPYMIDGIFGTDTDAARFTQHMIEQNRFGGGALTPSSTHKRSVRMPITLAEDPIVITSTCRELNAQSTILSINIENESVIDTMEISEIFVNIKRSELDTEKQWEWIISAQREAPSCSKHQQQQSQPLYAASVSQRGGGGQQPQQAMMVEDSFDTYSSVDGGGAMTSSVLGAVTRPSLLFKAGTPAVTVETSDKTTSNRVAFTLTPMHTMTAFTLSPRSGKTLLYRIDGQLSNLQQQVNILTSFGHFITPFGLYYQPKRAANHVSEKSSIEGLIKYDRIYRMQRLRWAINTNNSYVALISQPSSLFSLLEIQMSFSPYARVGEDCEVTIRIKNHMKDLIMLRPQLTFTDTKTSDRSSDNSTAPITGESWVVTPHHIGGLPDILPGETGKVTIKIRSLKTSPPPATGKEGTSNHNHNSVIKLDGMCLETELMKINSSNNESSKKKVVYRQLSPLQIPLVPAMDP